MSALLIIGLKNAILVVPLALIAWGVGRYSRRPALSHLLWTVVLLKLLTPPLIHVPVGWTIGVENWLQSTAGSPQNQPAAKPVAFQPVALNAKTNRPGSFSKSVNHLQSSRQQAAPIQSESVTSPLSTVVAGVKSTNYGTLTWRTLWRSKVELLLGVWLLGTLYVVSKLSWRARQFHQFLQLATRRHESLGARAAELAARTGITISPRVIVVEGCISPMLWGMGRRACLVFPARLIARLSATELDSLLLHELAHFARGDHWVRVLELVVGVFYWWHPIFWWARNELETAEEQCCDAWVVEHQNGSRHSYAQAILATIDFLHEPATILPPVACGLGEVPFLRMRLIQIMRGEVAARLPLPIATIILAGGILCSPLEPALWAKSTGSRTASLAKPQAAPIQGVASSNHPRPFDSNLRQDSDGTRHTAASTLLAEISSNSRINPKANSSHLLANTRPQTNVWADAHSPDGKYHIEARFGYQTTLTYAPNFRLDLTADRITCVSFATDSHAFATGHEDSIVRRWDCKTGGVLQSYKGCKTSVTSVHLSPDGRLLAAGTRSGEVVVWDVTSGDEVGHLEESRIAVSCVRWASQGDRLAISFGDWSEREQPQLIVHSVGEDKRLHEQTLPYPVGALQWLDNDESLVLVAWDGHARAWDCTSGQILAEKQIEKDRVSAAAWSADCSLFENWNDVESDLELESSDNETTGLVP